MENISLKSIKLESVRNIFGVIAKHKTVSRAEIAEETALSLMTVSKVTDALLERGVIRQTKPAKSSAGRRAGLLSLSPDFYTVILDLTEKNFVLSVINAKMEPVRTFPFAYDDDFLFRENLQRFLNDAAQYTRQSLNLAFCMGVGVSVPGRYFAEPDRIESDRIPEFGSLSVFELVQDAFQDLPVCIDSATNAAALSNAAEIFLAKEDVALYCYIGSSEIRGAVLAGSEILHGAHGNAGNLGKIHLSRNVTMENSVTAHTTQGETASLLAHMLYNALMLLDPEAVLLECQDKGAAGTLCDVVRDLLESEYKLDPERIPLLLAPTTGVCHAHQGLSLELRQMWLTRLVMEG